MAIVGQFVYVSRLTSGVPPGACLGPRGFTLPSKLRSRRWTGQSAPLLLGTSTVRWNRCATITACSREGRPCIIIGGGLLPLGTSENALAELPGASKRHRAATT